MKEVDRRLCDDCGEEKWWFGCRKVRKDCVRIVCRQKRRERIAEVRYLPK